VCSAPSHGQPHLLFIAPQTNIVVAPSLGVFRGQQTRHPASVARMHATCPTQSNFQRSIPSNRRVRRYGGRASVARRTQSSKRSQTAWSRIRRVHRLSTTSSIASFSSTRMRVSHQTLTSASVAPETSVHRTENTASHLGQSTRHGTGV
jgi:hypothetical protein